MSVGIAGLLFAAVICSFFFPLVLALTPLFTQRLDYGILRQIGSVARFTFIQAFLSALFASLIGLAAAFFCARRQFIGKKLLMSLSAVPLSIPPVVTALAFILFFGKNGVFGKALLYCSGGRYSTGTFLYTMGGVLMVHAFYNFPIAMRTISTVWKTLPEKTEQAAVLLGASPLRVFRTVIFPALKAPFAAAFLIIFLYSFFSFVIILLLGGLGITTLEVELYRTIRLDIHSAKPAVIATVETVLAAVAVLLYIKSRNTMRDAGTAQDFLRAAVPINPGTERLCFIILMTAIISCLVLPLASIFMHSLRPLQKNTEFAHFFTGLSFDAWVTLCKRPSLWKACVQTVQTGIGTASLSVIAAVFFGYCTRGRKKSALQALPFIPLAVSSIVLGAGWLRFGGRPSIFTLIAVQASLTWPLAWSQIEASLSKIPDTVYNAAMLLSASRSDAFFRVFLPLCKTGLISAFCCVFAVSAGDASLPLLLHIPKFENVSLLLFRYAGSYRFTESAAIAVILAGLTGSLFFLQEVFASRKPVRRQNGTHDNEIGTPLCKGVTP